LQYDLIVVGAGCAGCMAASTASKLGVKTLLLDRKAEAMIGDKVCGDGLGSHHLDYLGLSLPSECYYATSPGSEVHSPDFKSVFRTEDESSRAISLKRHEFGRFMLRMATSAGAELVDGFHVSCPMLDGGIVVGIKGIGKDGTKSYSAKVVADCSGMASAVRRGIPDGRLSRPLPKGDVMACYREIRGIKGKPPELCQIFLDMEKTPGGYAWIFPMGEELVNVGLGIKSDSGLNPRELFNRHIAPMAILSGSTLVNGGGGLVPTTGPMDYMVYDGLMIAGDAANTVSPIHGGGIGSSMRSGRILGEVCAEAISLGSVTMQGLWDYNRRYMAAYGAKQASLNIFRKFLQASTNDELNFGMAHKIVRPEDILFASKYGDLKLSITEKATRAFRGIGRLDFIVRLRRTAHCMKAMKKLYTEYPRFVDLDGWLTKVRAAESSA